ncbi:MAG: enoyl-CoA hydratase-related protein [Adhaeribacter sp.]
MEFLKVNRAIRPQIALLELHRPKELNALNPQLMAELRQALQELEEDEAVRVVVLTGNDKAFAAGADIKQMAGKSAVDMLLADQFRTWDQVYKFKKPLIAAVSGFALGGGCELAMSCDLIIASETAVFGQPEIKIGVLPGAGGTQRLTKALGKVKAMEMILTGKLLPAAEAEQRGLVNRVLPLELYLEEALRLAAEIARLSPIAVRLAKEAVLHSFETSLEQGLQYERKNFYLAFASDDQTEGMQAFIEKRNPDFKGR